MKRLVWLCIWFTCLSLVVSTYARPAANAAAAPASAPFYEGKTIRIIVGFPPGGFYDLWSRLLARHMGRHVPGNPRFIVQNIPGAGSALAANHLYQLAKPDGLTFGTVVGSLYLMQMGGASGVEFDWPKFTFVGRTTGDTSVFYVRADSPYRTWQDVRAAKEPIPVGASGTASGTYIVPQVMKETFGFNLNLITGYPGGAPIDAAMERGELTGSSRSIGPYVGREPFLTWHKKGFVRPIVQTGKERDRRLDANVPTVWDIARELRSPKADLEFMETAFKGLDEWFWLYIAPPGIPAERVKILRDGFHKALNDPRLREEGAKIGLIPDPTDPVEIQRLAAEVMNVDRKTMERVKKLLGH
jgi:tripartite-type tricarboxylate transporter receptor subunit TctC